MAYGTVNADSLVSSDGGIISPNINSLRNRIINGAMMIDQRNAGASVTPTNGQYLVDRYFASLTQASKYSTQQNAGAVTPPIGFVNYLGATSLSAYSVVAGDIFALVQRIEANNVSDLSYGTASASPLTLSFWVRSSLTGTFGGSLLNSSASKSYVFSYTVNAANTWEQKSITIAGDTAAALATGNNAAFGVYFSLGMGSTYSTTAGSWVSGAYFAPTGATSVVGTNGATFYVTGVQLEKGSTATSFDYRPYGTELVLCQRYFQIVRNGNMLGNSTTAVIVNSMLSPTMRTTPSLSQQGVVEIGSGTTDRTQTSVGVNFLNGTNDSVTYQLLNYIGVVASAGYQYRLSANTNGATASAEL